MENPSGKQWAAPPTDLHHRHTRLLQAESRRDTQDTTLAVVITRLERTHSLSHSTPPRYGAGASTISGARRAGQGVRIPTPSRIIAADHIVATPQHRTKTSGQR